MDKDSPYSARPEAQPEHWSKLTQDQQRAARQVCGILNDLATQRWTEPHTKERKGVKLFLPHVDEMRLNHVVLIDGGRGTGKTALLMTLLHAWSMKVQGTTSAVEAPPEELFDPKRRVVPVGLVDLQPLPKSTNLIIHLVGQLLRVVEAIEQSDSDTLYREQDNRRRTVAPWHAIEEERRTLAAAWKRFLQAAAGGWSANVEARRAKLDIEAYAEELEQSARRRMEVLQTFREFGDELVAAYVEWQRLPKGEEPLFVVAIDDADMNPERAPELLDLIRTLWHPRFGFVLTGESELFQTIVRQDVSKHIQDAGKAERLATQFYDKVIPLSHRCELRALRTYERLRDPLGAALASLPAPRDPDHPQVSFGTLKDYFELQAQACEILPDRPRAQRDLASRIETMLQEKVHDVTAEVIAEIALPHQSPRVVGDLEGRPSATRRLRGTFASMSRVVWKPAQDESIIVDLRPGLRLHYQPRLSILARWEGLRERPSWPLHETASVLLAYDAFGVPAPWVAAQGLRGLLVHTSIDDRIYAWPLPDWGRPIHYAAFSYALNVAVGSDDGFQVPADLGRTLITGAGVDWLARTFIMLVLEYGRHVDLGDGHAETHLSLTRLRDFGRSARNAPRWPVVADECARVVAANPGERMPPPTRTWAQTRAGLFAAPESGLPQAIADGWLQELKEAFSRRLAPWGVVNQSLWFERRTRTRIALGYEAMTNESEAVRDAVNEHQRGLDAVAHAWDQLVVDPEGMWPKVEQLTAQMRGAGGRTQGAPPVTLQDYIRPRRDRFASASYSTHHDWNAQLKRLTDPSGALMYAINTMWMTAVSHGDAPELKRSVSKLARPFLVAVIRSSGRADAPRWIYRGHLGTTIGSRLLIAQAEYGWLDDKLYRNLSGALLEVAWDARVDAEDKLTEPKLIESWLSPWWDAAGGQFEIGKVIPWPAPRWPAFLDQYEFVRAWNEKVMSVVPNAAWPSFDDEGLTASVEHWYLSANLNLAISGSANVALNLSVATDDWESVLGGIKGPHSASKQGARWSSFFEWTARVPLMAAPESGLSADVARVLLNHLNPSNSRALMAARLERMKQLVPSDKDAAAYLRKVDQQSPGHPWVQKFGVYAERALTPPSRKRVRSKPGS